MYLLLGYLGYGNYGDELLAQIAEKKLLAAEPSASVKRLSSLNNFSDHLQLIFSSKEIITLGGLWQDETSLRSLTYYSVILLLAKLLAKRIRVLANGIGPLRSALARAVCHLTLSMADEISVRDRVSSQLLSNWGVSHTISQDLVLAYDYKLDIHENSRQKIDNLFSSYDEKLLCISLKEKKGINEQELFKELKLKVSGELGKCPIMILQMQNTDEKLHKAFLKYSSLEAVFLDANEFSIEEIMYILRTYVKSVYSMRLHALFLAQRAGLSRLNIIQPDEKLLANLA